MSLKTFELFLTKPWTMLILVIIRLTTYFLIFAALVMLNKFVFSVDIDMYHLMVSYLLVDKVVNEYATFNKKIFKKYGIKK